MLRDYQQEAVDAAWQCVRRRQCPVIDLPTGSGKSWVIAELCRQAADEWGGRCIVTAHRKELLQQNAEKIETLLPGKVGIYSAGLKKRDIEHDVVCAGIQSVWNKASELCRRHVVIVDECHLINNADTGTYREFIGKLRKYNPGLAVIGLTATPYRTNGGLITSGDLFDTICYRAEIRDLIDQGYLCKLTTPAVQTSTSMQHVHIRKGEYVQREMEDAFLHDAQEACQELVARAADRQSVIVFTSGISHADRVTELIEDMAGEDVETVTGKTLPLLREASLRKFKEGSLKWLVNVNVLTTGFDATRIDCVALMRASVSPGLVAQMIGRGLRIDDSKEDCLILDFGENVARHGPIDSKRFGKRAVEKKVCPLCDKVLSLEAKECPCGFVFPVKVKECPDCGETWPLGTTECAACGNEFKNEEWEGEREKKKAELDRENHVLQESRWKDVDSWSFSKHRKRSDPNSITLRVDYQIDLTTSYSEWICIEHEEHSFPWRKAKTWWYDHSAFVMPETIDEALEMFEQGGLRQPSRIQVIRDGKFYRIAKREFDSDKPTELVEIGNAFDEEELPF